MNANRAFLVTALHVKGFQLSTNPLTGQVKVSPRPDFCQGPALAEVNEQHIALAVARGGESALTPIWQALGI
ncbi:MAG: hypothetical protein KKA73_18310 [Chloroflexi bacterium]|nr:hypothetical protein [Chloroflexota bacterium]MBU1749641.1 hypothetical protein [Chloroflexota bacterium]